MYYMVILLTLFIFFIAVVPALCGPKVGPLKNNSKLDFDSPADPPFFVWPAQPEAKSYHLEISRSTSFPANETISTGLTRNFFLPEKTLGSGKWFYRIKPDNGEWSDIYTVTIAEDATRFIVPKRKGFIEGHPRLYIHAEDIPTFRKDAAGVKKDLWLKIEEQADALLGKPLIQEPPRYKRTPEGGLDIESWRNVVNAGGVMSSNLITLSFTYIISQDKKYLNEAVRLMDHVCAWQIPGSTADPSHVDHPARDILHGLCIAYDWLYNDLSPEEREKIRNVIIARADKLYQFDNPFYGMGVNNHPWLRMAALADAGCVLLGDYPTAEEWLDYTEGLYAGRFWCLGGKEGEWHEGISYWSYALLFALEFADVVKSATGVDFYKHPWIQKCSYFPIYAYAPGSSGLPYGDVHPNPADVSTTLTEMRLAKETGNPYAKWWVDHPLESRQFYVQRFLADDPKLSSKPPTDIPQSMLFTGPGWSVFHTSLAGSDDVFFTMKSGHFYNSGHEHPDQNSFALEAYKKRLVIDSGYYDWYSSPHHYGWVMLNKAHNIIIVNGQGQAGMLEGSDINAHGKTTAFFRSPSVNYAVGDASNPAVYKGAVKRFLRMVAFITPDVIVIYDIVDLPKPSHMDWLLHTTADPAMSRNNNAFDMAYEGVGLRFDMLTPDKVEFSRTIGYDPKPEKIDPKDAHMTFSIPGNVPNARFLTVYQPYKLESGKPSRKLTRIKGNGAVAAQVGSDEVLFRDSSDSGMVSAGRIETDGLMATAGDDKWSICRGQKLVIDGKAVLSSTQVVSASKSGSNIYIDAEKACTVKIALDKAPAKIPAGWRWDSKSKLLIGRKKGTVPFYLIEGGICPPP